MTDTCFVKGADYEIGDVLWTGQQSHRIVRFQPYTHPVPEIAESFGAATRVAFCDDGYEVTMTEHGSWPMPAEQAPPGYFKRVAAQHNH